MAARKLLILGGTGGTGRRAMNTQQREAVAELAACFRRNGYVRRQNPDRLADEGYWQYKKGEEVRLVADSVRELKSLRRALRRVGFKPGRPFRKSRQYRQPVYGRDEVARFLKLVAAGDV